MPANAASARISSPDHSQLRWVHRDFTTPIMNSTAPVAAEAATSAAIPEVIRNGTTGTTAPAAKATHITNAPRKGDPSVSSASADSPSYLATMIANNDDVLRARRPAIVQVYSSLYS